MTYSEGGGSGGRERKGREGKGCVFFFFVCLAAVLEMSRFARSVLLLCMI